MIRARRNSLRFEREPLTNAQAIDVGDLDSVFCPVTKLI